MGGWGWGGGGKLAAKPGLNNIKRKHDFIEIITVINLVASVDSDPFNTLREYQNL